jgi:hypothetical protein
MGLPGEDFMNRFIARSFAAVVTAGAAATALSTPVGAAARPAHRSVPVAYDQSAAGYVSSGWRFRFVAATLKVPALQDIKGDNGPAGVSLSDGTHTAALLVQTGGGAGSITYDNGFGHGTVPLAPRAGNILRVSVYRDPAGDRDVFEVTNTSTGRTWSAPVATPAGIVYRQASETASLDNATAGAPLDTVRLWSFRSVRVTSYSGIRGTVTGPWLTSELIDTLDGTSHGQSELFPRPPWGNSDQNFTVWRPESPH